MLLCRFRLGLRLVWVNELDGDGVRVFPMGMWFSLTATKQSRGICCVDNQFFEWISFRRRATAPLQSDAHQPKWPIFSWNPSIWWSSLRVIAPAQRRTKTIKIEMKINFHFIFQFVIEVVGLRQSEWNSHAEPKMTAFEGVVNAQPNNRICVGFETIKLRITLMGLMLL